MRFPRTISVSTNVQARFVQPKFSTKGPFMAKTPPEPTAGLVVAGMLGGYLTGRITQQRPLAGVVLGACGTAAGPRVRRSSGAGTSAPLSTLYTRAFGLSRPA